MSRYAYIYEESAEEFYVVVLESRAEAEESRDEAAVSEMRTTPIVEFREDCDFEALDALVRGIADLT
ncbi:hypothetical protein [Nocardia sp. NPDC050435]|uniref:hypothetical protein n=1 Tax=Nocardia sp. NPDC050435 TaxID=3155040 RepID=UPI00340AEAAB